MIYGWPLGKCTGQDLLNSTKYSLLCRGVWYTTAYTDGNKTLHTLLIKYCINCLDGQSRVRGSAGVGQPTCKQAPFFTKTITEPIFKNFQENFSLCRLKFSKKFQKTVKFLQKGTLKIFRLRQAFFSKNWSVKESGGSKTYFTPSPHPFDNVLMYGFLN